MLLEILSGLIFIGVLFLILLIDFLRFKINLLNNQITYMSLPFIILYLLNEIYLNQLTSINIGINVLMIWLIGMLFVWLGSIISNLFSSFKIFPTHHKYKKNILLNEVYFDLIYLIINITIWISIFIRFPSLNVNLIASDTFVNFLGEGIFGWFRIFIIIYSIFLSTKYNFKQLLSYKGLLVLFGFSTLLINQIKGIAFAPILAIIIFKFIYSKKKLLYFSLVPFFFIMVFFIAYSIPFILSTNLNQFQNYYSASDLLNTTFNYIFSGIYGFSKLLELNIDLTEPFYNVFAPLYNLFRRFWDGPRAEIVIKTYIPIFGLFRTNVFTIIGTVYSVGGPFLFPFYFFFVGYLGNFLYLKSKFNVIFRMGFSTYLAFMTFGIFDLFFQHTFVMIILFIFIIWGYLYNAFKIKRL